ncbi:MAG: winged helix-turn-helix transcriptional regulator [Candidatus Thermoplasmatota archaeon]|nr:winged helix-turn-helix transcriptional regulator [Candidatus Thermoplasmatota archaeon]
MMSIGASPSEHKVQGGRRGGHGPRSMWIVSAAIAVLVLIPYAASAFTDEDQDGIDDDWERIYDLDPTDPTDAEEDPDGDGFTNLEEYKNGTDPTDPYSYPRGPNDGTAEEKDASGMASSIGVCMFVLGSSVVLLIIFGIYTKIRKERLLDHETRKRIVEHLRRNPGAHYSAILGDLGLPHGVLTHHLNMLESQELVFSKQDRHYRRFYVDGMYMTGPLILGTQKAILDEIRRSPGRSQSEVARKLGISRMVVYYHITELEKMGLASARKDGRSTGLYPSPVLPGDMPGSGLHSSRTGIENV